MRIAIIGSIASEHILKWANGLSNNGTEVHLITLHEPKIVFKENFITHRLRFDKLFGYITNIIQLRRLLCDIQSSIVHSFYLLRYGTLGTF